MTRITNYYCRNFHLLDVLSQGKCEMCGGTGLIPSFQDNGLKVFGPVDDEPEMTEEELRKQEIESHLHP